MKDNMNQDNDLPAVEFPAAENTEPVAEPESSTVSAQPQPLDAVPVEPVAETQPAVEATSPEPVAETQPVVEAAPPEPIAETQPAMDEPRLAGEEPAADAPSEFEKMMEAYEQKISDLHKGAFVEGRIVKIQEMGVLVDIGARCEGVFPVEEIKDNQGNLLYKEGDAIMVQVISSTRNDFTIQLSHRNAYHHEAMRELRRAYQEGIPVEGTITESIKGGMKVSVRGVEAFLPASQIDLRYVEKTDDFVGRKERFRIMKFNPRLGKMVVSRKVLLQEEKEQQKQTLWESLQVGQIVRGRVTRLTGYGVFIDLGGMEGLIHISNLSWDKVKKPSELVKVGQEVDALVVELDKEKERIGLGLKQMVQDPWLSIYERYHLDQKVAGVVEKLESFGAFVKLEPGVTALIPISEMSWSKRINHPSELMAAGNSIEAVVLRIDPDERKISLSLKKVTPSPFALFLENHNTGDVMDGEVTNVVGYGAFVKLEDGIEGLLHVSEMSWSPVRNIDEFVQKGSHLSVRIININPVEEKISLSARMGEPPPSEEQSASPDYHDRERQNRDSRPPRGGRKPFRKDKDDDEHKYILNDAPSVASKLGERFPQALLDKLKSRQSD